MDEFDDELLQKMFQDWASAGPSGENESAGKRKRSSADGLDVHKRWRMRQKLKAKDLDDELQAKQMMHDALQAENTVLQRKIKVLESVLAMREDKLSQLSAEKAQQQQQQQQQQWQQQGESEAHAPSPSQPASCPAHQPIMQPRQHSQRQHGTQQGQQQLVQFDLPSGEHSLIPDPPAEGKELSFQNIPPVAMWDHRWMRRMKQVTPTEWRRLWLEFMRESSMFALGAEAHGYGSAAYDQLTQVVQTYFGVLDQITLLQPAVYYDSLYINISTGRPEVPPVGHWQAVARAVANVADAPVSRPCSAVSSIEEEDGGKANSWKAAQEIPHKQQVQDCLAALELFDAKMSSVLQERSQLATSIQSYLHRDGHATPEHPATGLLMAGIHLDNWAALLAANVDAEQNAHNCMSDYLCARLLSPLQLVKAVAASYPFIPDVTAIVRSMKSW